MSHHNPARGMHKQYLNRANVERRFSPTAVFGSSTSDTPTTTDDPLFPFPTPSTTSDPDPIFTSSTRTHSQIIPDPITTSSSSNIIPTVVTTSSSTSTTLSTSTTSTTSLPLTTSSSLTTSASVVVPSQTVIQTFTSPTLSSQAASAATTSAASTGASKISTGAIVGGIAAAAVGIGAVFFAAIFFIRKWRRKNEEEVEWNARNFRQSAVLVDDDAASTNSRFNPRPPTMFERKFANTPPSQGYGGTANFGGLAGAGAHGGHPDDFQSFAPGEVVWSPTSADPMAPMPGYGPSPVGSPVSVSPYDSQLDQYGNLTRQPSDPSGAYLTRAPSAGQQFDPNGSAHYADLSRSSVTPFQAAQYAEITRRLNDPQFGPVHEVDEPLSPAAASPVPYALQPGMKHKSLTGALEDASAGGPSPFADPLPSPFEAPVTPPAAAHVAPDSGSPTLPLPRVFSPIASEFPAGAHAAEPASPPPAVTRNSGERQLQAPPAAVRPNTVYNEEDVYGGI